MRTNGESRTYSNGNGHHVKSPAEIEKEIEVTRARMNHTIEAIRKDLSPGQIVDQALHYIKDAKVGQRAGDMASSMASSVGGVVKANPLPAVVVGAGLTWLLISNHRAKQEPKSDALRTGEMSGSFDALPGIDTTSTYSSSTSSTELPMLSTSEHEEHGRFEHVKERAQHMSHSAAERARKTGVKAQETAIRAKDSTIRGYEAQPLVVGAIAVGIGALLGSLLPSTSRENQLMGKKRDELMRKADEVGADVLGRAKEKVDSGVQMVKEKMERSSGLLQGEQVKSEQQQFGEMGVPSTTFESEMAPTTGGVSGQTAYGTSNVEPIIAASTTTTVVQSAPLPVPEEIFSGSSSSSSEIEGAEPPSFPPKGRGPGV